MNVKYCVDMCKCLKGLSVIWILVGLPPRMSQHSWNGVKIVRLWMVSNTNFVHSFLSCIIHTMQEGIILSVSFKDIFSSLAAKRLPLERRNSQGSKPEGRHGLKERKIIQSIIITSWHFQTQFCTLKTIDMSQTRCYQIEWQPYAWLGIVQICTQWCILITKPYFYVK